MLTRRSGGGFDTLAVSVEKAELLPIGLAMDSGSLPFQKRAKITTLAAPAAPAYTEFAEVMLSLLATKCKGFGETPQLSTVGHSNGLTRLTLKRHQ